MTDHNSEKDSNLVRVTIGDNLTCSFPEGNEVPTKEGKVRFENFTRLKVEVRFEQENVHFHVPHDEGYVFDVARLSTPGKHEFTVHEITDEGRNPDILGEGAIVIKH